jgi:heptosyltransferase-3
MKKILLIAARNFGDGVIITELIKQFYINGYQIDILTRKEFKPIFYHANYKVNIFTANFPMGTMKNFDYNSLIHLIKLCYKLRSNNYDFVLNNVGDFRENIIGWYIKPKKNISILWDDLHPYKRLIRPGMNLLVDEFIKIPSNILNIYDVQKFIANSILACTIKDQELLIHKSTTNIIAIHPMASQKTRFWEHKNWIEVIKEFGTTENKILVFCAPNEVKELKYEFKDVEEKIEIVAKDLNYFFNKLKEVDLFIGLDSFSIHSAYMMNVPNLIMLNGANDSRVWAPPKTKVLEGGKNCEYFPCYNKPKCIGKDFEYICMKSIKPQEVINTIKDIKNATNNTK